MLIVSGAGSARPSRLTLLITTYDRTKLLRRSLRRLAQLTVPDEIVLVDDGGSDGCEKIVDEFPDLPIRYVYHDNPGHTTPCMARNVGLGRVTGEYLLVADPELLFITDVVAQCRPHHGTNVVVMPGSFYFLDQAGSMNVHELDVHYGLAGIGGSLMFVETNWIVELGGWDEGFTGTWGPDDIDLLTRLRIRGHGHVLPAEIQVAHQWHPHVPYTVDGPRNWAYFESRPYRLDERTDHPGLIVNR